MAEMQRLMAAGEPLIDFLAESADRDAQAAEEWRVVLDDLNSGGVGLGGVGYFGVSYGASVGIPLIATEPRIRAAVIGLAGGELLERLAARITVPVEFDLQWDDELIPRASGLALFEALGSSEKTMHVNAGGHVDLPRFEVDSAARFFERHLG
jgi:dienelactone hydrolase